MRRFVKQTFTSIKNCLLRRTKRRTRVLSDVPRLRRGRGRAQRFVGLDPPRGPSRKYVPDIGLWGIPKKTCKGPLFRHIAGQQRRDTRWCAAGRTSQFTLGGRTSAAHPHCRSVRRLEGNHCSAAFVWFLAAAFGVPGARRERGGSVCRLGRNAQGCFVVHRDDRRLA